jgi:geranylgeranyl diphosphate synthase, type II
MTSLSLKDDSELAPLADFFSRGRELIDAKLEQLLPAETLEPVAVHSAIRWSVFAGGKRFRPLLLLAAGETLGAGRVELLATACALELIHTYSLIHDDLPSMDNDDLRRGRPTCHIRFGEATAILAGDALQSLAFQTIAEDEALDASQRLKLITELASAAGTPHGMVAGQALDLEAESREVSGIELEQSHGLKTGALISAAARCGAVIANADDVELDLVTRYAAQLGLLFQITDDLLDVTATAEALGKTPGKDARSRKATFPSIYGIEATRERARRVHEETLAALAELNRDTGQLRAIANFILHRKS